ncbi:competence protein ComK [Jeotgalibacillus haloalkalitolerans]|uniref:Competence protein ComK n=1 Tax=Jeotgalibacillus haloalkalitolerans TaxID=3104292 RepID=A0ABU5KP62_9BACL|nr:competence protein ComK [Jeotgalibacillus sp. HH7-29]MDZ5713047.1 competence protein ComK [Jeotgalibacillus sp. HH7-29]
MEFMTATETYTVSTNTMILEPRVEDGSLTGTIIHEKGRLPFSVDMKPMEIMEHSCLYYFSSYEGRKTSSRFLTNFSHKPPIVVDPISDIYFFSTHSDSNKKNYWIALNHVVSMEKNDDLSNETTLTLSGDRTITLPISRRATHLQYLKASVLSLKLHQNINGIRERSEDTYKTRLHKKRFGFAEYLDRIENVDQDRINPDDGGDIDFNRPIK